MTEAEWLACESIDEMLWFHRGAATPRKLRLLACASCRRLWDLLTSRADREAVEVAERYADRAVPDARRAEARRKTSPTLKLRERLGNPFNPAHFAVGRTRDQASEVRHCLFGARNAASIAETLRTGTFGSALRDEEVAHCALAREIFGNPFCPVRLNRAWLTPAVTSLAQVAYDTRILPSGHLDPAHLTVLTDALEEAGCTNPEVLSHCRSGGEHVRGCWVLDLLTGRE